MATVPVLEANATPLVRKRPADGSTEYSQQPANKRSVPDPGMSKGVIYYSIRVAAQLSVNRGNAELYRMIVLV